MPQFIEIQTGKSVGAYGGVASIIEATQGALIIEPFDSWPFFQHDLHTRPENQIDDNRLLTRLQYEKGFPKLQALVRVPSNVENIQLRGKPQNPDKVISAKYFPQWFYCPHCNRFRPLDHWWEGWKSTLKKYKKIADYIRNSFYSGPKCCYCYNDSQGKKRYLLEQVRFVIIAPSGGIEDIPWEYWNMVEKRKPKDDDSDEGSIRIIEEHCCNAQDLRYRKSTHFADLAGIWIECKNCKKKQTLHGLFGYRSVDSAATELNKRTYKKAVIRTSNSVYYPLTISSIYLPVERRISTADAQLIDSWLEAGKNDDFIVDAISVRSYSEEVIRDYIKNRKEPEFEPEIAYRTKEYNFLTAPNRKCFPASPTFTDNLIFENQPVNELSAYGLSHLISMKRLKLTTVQIAYSRQEPLDRDAFMEGKFKTIKPGFTSSKKGEAEYLPAVENFGEGIFFTLDIEKILNWRIAAFKNSRFKNRIGKIGDNLKKSRFVNKDKFKHHQHMARFILLHTLSHILMKELEFSVGYPTTSLRERLYIDEDSIAGVMIYTVAGAEGSYGGLISKANQKDFKTILRSALYRATDCSSDPLCYNNPDGQGVGGLNMAACYSCALIPEISCEEMNCYLDRALLIDKEFGFFRDVVKDVVES